EAVLEVIRLEEEYSLLARKLSAFARLKHSTNTTDAETVKYQNLLRQKDTEVSKEYVIMNKFLANEPNLEAYMAEDEKLSAYRFMLEENKAEM
ncbi:hypothetical protein, partial [Turicimonas muris]|uniref:hypothetical protein n=1 Tax=Turicimonas muris TaxID=1796652 RepID=UPI0024B97B25